ncbi:unnamed protein product [Acanthosepion pharaonis]|uniref:Reverse transcriptase domain-containing protein n=1 Tax=Acanthosepion pharaonis TaxID=158019 RepID=A0A812CMF8_ACAPH|nr:unnamed protein product [Sepia pharaonis]
MPIDSSALDTLPTLPGLPELVSVPTLDEVNSAIKSIRNKKSLGDDDIPGEVYEYGGPHLASYLHFFFNLYWTSRMIPKRWKHANIISIYKKGDRFICDNSRGISLLDVARKILARIMLRRLLILLIERTLPESQCAFRPERSNLGMIFVANPTRKKKGAIKRD